MREYIVEDAPWELYDQDPLTELLSRQDGIISSRQARRYLSEKAIRHRLARGEWRRVHRGIFRTYTGNVSDAQLRWIAVLAASPDPLAPVAGFGADHGVYLGGLSALCEAGLAGVTSREVHLLVPNTRQHRFPPGVVVHRVRHLPPEDCHPVAQPPRTIAGRSVVDAAAWARSDNQARLVIAASFQQRLVTFGEITAILDRRSPLPRRRLITTVAADCAAGSHSLAELDFLRICRQGKLPLPTRQRRRRDASGRMRYLDACFDDVKVAVEIDGAHHADVRQMWDDQERQNDLSLAGYLVLRYPAWVIRDQPERVIADLRRALGR